MMLLFLAVILAELNESGYLFSVGKEQFLSIEGDKVRLIEKKKMPKKFEIETRGGDSSYFLRIYPSPRQGDKVMDKDWWYNDHKLIFYPINDWQSQHFIFSLLPKNMLKIVVKERCAEVKEDGSLKASLCKGREDNKNQYFRWIREEDRGVVQAFVRKHGGGRAGDEDLGYRERRRGGRGGDYDRDGEYGRGEDYGRRGGGRDEERYDRGYGSVGCNDYIDCDEEGDKYRRAGYTGDDDFFFKKPSRGRRRGNRLSSSFDLDDDIYDADDDNAFYGDSDRRGRGSRRGKRRSPLAEAMCSDNIDEIGKIICEINRMPNLVI